MNWLILSFGLLFFHMKGPFDPKNFYTDIQAQHESEENLKPYLEQTYTYLAEGSQVYAFVSKDGKTVLKIFKAKHEKPFKFSRFVRHKKKSPEDWKISKNKWQKKFQDSCMRYTWANNHLKEETGLIGIHFNQTDKPLFVKIKSKYTHRLDLSTLPFILQKKALLAPEYFKKYPEKKEAAKEALKELFISRTKKGYTDSRQSFRINYGFIDDQPIQIDVGKLEVFLGDEDEEIAHLHSRVNEWTSRF